MTRTNASRPPSVLTALGLLAFLGVTALGGGIEMLLFPHGNEYLPTEWLDGIPLVQSWVLPGLVLGLGFGAGSLVVGWGMFRKPRWGWLHRGFSRNGLHWSWVGCVLLGLGLILWVALELVFIPKRSLVEAAYGVIGVALATLPLLPSTKSHLRST